MSELDIETLKRSAANWPQPGLWGSERARIFDQLPAIIAALEDRERLRAAAQEVWDSVPASYEPADAMVRRHAEALIALGTALEDRDG